MAGQRKTKNVAIVHSNDRFRASNGGLLILIIGTLTRKVAPWQQKTKPSTEEHAKIEIALPLMQEKGASIYALPDRLTAILCVFADRMAQLNIGFSTQDLELFQQAVAANLAVHPYFVNLVNRSIPKDAATKSELAQVCNYADQGSDLHHHAKLLLCCCPAWPDSNCAPGIQIS